MDAGEKRSREREEERRKRREEEKKKPNCGGHLAEDDRQKLDRTLSTTPPQPSPRPDTGKKKPQQTDGPLSGNTKPPMDFIAEAEPIKVHGAVVASTGVEDPALGCPVEFIDLRGTSKERPAVCKYTGNKYYSDDWAHAH